MKRIKDKISEIENYISELESLFPIDYKLYKRDFKIRAICERYFERIIESVIDLAFLVIKEKDLKIPEDDKNVFDILENKKAISNTLTNKMKDAKGMRNIIAHEYGKIDDELVHYAITEELLKDVEECIKSIENYLKI